MRAHKKGHLMIARKLDQSDKTVIELNAKKIGSYKDRHLRPIYDCSYKNKEDEFLFLKDFVLDSSRNPFIPHLSFSYMDLNEVTVNLLGVSDEAEKANKEFILATLAAKSILNLLLVEGLLKQITHTFEASTFFTCAKTLELVNRVYTAKITLEAKPKAEPTCDIVRNAHLYMRRKRIAIFFNAGTTEKQMEDAARVISAKVPRKSA